MKYFLESEPGLHICVFWVCTVGVWESRQAMHIVVFDQNSGDIFQCSKPSMEDKLLLVCSSWVKVTFLSWLAFLFLCIQCAGLPYAFKCGLIWLPQIRESMIPWCVPRTGADAAQCRYVWGRRSKSNVGMLPVYGLSSIGFEKCAVMKTFHFCFLTGAGSIRWRWVLQNDFYREEYMEPTYEMMPVTVRLNYSDTLEHDL